MLSVVPHDDNGYAIGITIFVAADGDLGFYENGLRQNVVFLFQLFTASPRCRRVYLLNHGDGEPGLLPIGLEFLRPHIVRTATIQERLDFVLQVGAAMDRETLLTLRATGARIIAYKGGNGAIIAMESVCSQPPRSGAEHYLDLDLIDAIWMTPQHIATYAGWCRTLYRCPVQVVPQIWSPLFIETRPTDIVARFGYKPGKRSWRVGVLDPNITVMKTSHVPMLICEAAYRLEPSHFSAFYITNGWPHRENHHFNSFTLSLSATRAGVMTLEPRFVSVDFLTNHCDAVVTHNWENGLNYLYYETLYGEYPLVHNSGFLKDYGYYYPNFSATDGANALLSAVRSHDFNLEQQQVSLRELFRTLSPNCKELIEAHEICLDKIEIE